MRFNPSQKLLLCFLLVGCGSTTVGGIDGSVDPDGSSTAPDGSSPDGSVAPDSAVVDAAVPEDLDPCANGRCWPTGIDAAPCSYGLINENFSSGLYNVHAYAAAATPDVPAVVTLTRTGGTWQPLLIVADDAGRILSDGQVAVNEPGLQVIVGSDGSTGDQARVEVTSTQALALTVYVTGWHVAGGDFAPDMPTDSTYRLRLEHDCDDPPGYIAPPGTLPGESLVGAGTHNITIGSGDWGDALRVDAAASEYIGFRLDFTPTDASVEMQVLMWDGQDAVSLGITNAGPGLRVLAARDPEGERTFWVRAQGTPSSGTLTIHRTPLSETPPCQANCDDLLQLPLPVDAMAQGYDMPGHVIYRYQFGRRELLTTIFHAGRRMVDYGVAPFTVKDMSRWDGLKPPDHETHQDGFHADISLYNDQGNAIWAALCTNDGEMCTTGVGETLDEELMAQLLGALFETDIVSTIYLDDVFIPLVQTEADTLFANGDIDSATHALIDSNALRHVIYHFHHIHVRTDGL